MACFIAQGLGGTADLSLRALVTSQEKIRGTVGKHTPRTRACLSLMQGFEEKPQESQGQWRGWGGKGSEWESPALGVSAGEHLRSHWGCRSAWGPGRHRCISVQTASVLGFTFLRALPLLKFLEGDKPKSVSSGFIVG